MTEYKTARDKPGRKARGPYSPKLFFTASSPGLPSKVVTPSSHALSCGGLVFSHSCAAFDPSVPSVRILFITTFSMSTVNFRFLMNLAAFGHSSAKPAWGRQLRSTP